MPGFPRRGLRTVRGKIDSLVLWYYQRGYTQSMIQQIVQERYGREFRQYAERSFVYWRQTGRAAEQLRQLTIGQNVDLVQSPTRTRGQAYYRLHVVIRFNNPQSGERTNRGYIVDVNQGLSKQQVYRQIRQIIQNQLMQHYQ